MQRVAIICGPTASGKTGLAVELAALHPVEIISADSRQLVRFLNIGTAKPSDEERRSAPFHLIDCIDPGERYSAFRFIGDATRIINEILGRAHVPVVVGGTGLYLRALTDGVVEIEEPDMQIREQLEREFELHGSLAMHERLKEIDPLEASKIHPNNRLRVLRALEVFQLTGKTKSELTATGTYRKGEFDFQYFCLWPPREQLYAAINSRVDKMIVAGLEEEIVRLISDGWKAKIRQANIIGYNEMLDYLDGRMSKTEAIAMIKQNSRHYAKRQMTWFRKQQGCRFYASPDDLKRELRLA